MDTFINTLLSGTPIAILAALVGVIWQLFYAVSRDRINDEQVRRELDLERNKFSNQIELEKQKFNYQKELETLKFAYEQKRWREELARDMTLQLHTGRIEEYSQIWSHVKNIAATHRIDGSLSIETAKDLAQKVKAWRYSKGGLLAETTTRAVAYAFQKALWEYDGSRNRYKQMRNARRLFRTALRADIGLTEYEKGKTLFDLLEERQNIKKELEKLQKELDIADEAS